MSYYRAYREGSPPFAKIVVQFTDGLRESEVFTDKLPAWGETAWRVTVNDSSLIVTRDASREALFGAHSHFVEFFALTMVTELAVAAVVLGWGFRARGRRLSIALAYVALANLLSYPVTWFSWPAMAQFQPDASRRAAVVVAVVVALCAAGLVNIVRTEGTMRRKKMAIALVLLLLGFAASPVAALLLFYGNSRIAVHGLPFGVTILLAEVFAIAFEAVLLYLLARKTWSMPLWQAAVISCVMNVASYLLGRLIPIGWP